MSKSLAEKNPNETKENIFRTAARLFSDRGYNGVSMREISEESGVTKPTIYYYFGSKDGIYKELIDAGLNMFLESFDIIQHDEFSAKEKLVIMTKKLFGFAVKYPEFAKFFMTIVTPLADNEILRDFKSEVKKKGSSLISVIDEGIKSGEFGASAKPELAATIIGGVWEHMVMLQIASKKRILSNKLAEDTIEILFKGLNE